MLSGLPRNLLTILAALPRYGRSAPYDVLSCVFHVTPLDTGIATLKSDRYLQLAESAQVDYMLKTGLMGVTLRQRWAFVNASQLVQFGKPVRMFDRVVLETQVVYADTRCAYFSHRFLVRGAEHAQVLVKMKFKNGPVTVPPQQVLGPFSGAKPQRLQRWDDTLASV